MDTKQREADLKVLLGTLAAGAGRKLSNPEVRLLADSLAQPGSSSDHSLAYLCLSRYCQAATASETDVARTERVTGTFELHITSTFAAAAAEADADTANVPRKPEPEIPPESYVPATALVAGIYPFAPASATTLLTHPLGPAGPPAPDSLTILLEAAEFASPLQRAFADLLAQAAGTKQGKELIRTRCLEWLRGAVDYGDDKELGVMCAVALSKLGRTETRPAAATGEGQAGATITPIEDYDEAEEQLCRKMMAHVVSSAGTAKLSRSTLLPTLEGLSVLSNRPAIKELLIRDPDFLRSLLNLSPVPAKQPGSLPVTPRSSFGIDRDFEDKLFEPVETSLCYGITTILVNLTSKRPQLSAEDQQIAKLRQMAISGKNASTAQEEDVRDGDEAVDARVKILIKAGVVATLPGLVRAESKLVKQGLGRLCLNLVEDKTDRPAFVRDGGFKVLSLVIRDLSSTTVKPQSTVNAKNVLDSVGSESSDTSSLLPAVQALAKLIITTNPAILFPAPATTTALNALTPLYTLLTHPSSALLQRFEALMALTNLASVDPSIGDRIVEAKLALPNEDGIFRGSGREDNIRVMGKVEEMMLDDNVFCRRAATELVCNLVGCSKGWTYFTGEDDSSKSGARIKIRLNVLLVLTNVDDLPTRTAAGGALAGLTESPKACEALVTGSRDIEDDKKRTRSVWSRVRRMLLPDRDHAAEKDDGDEREDIPVISSAPPDTGLVHRGVIILLNLVTYAASLESEAKKALLEEAKRAQVEDSLVGILQMRMPNEVLQPVVECIKLLRQHA